MFKVSAISLPALALMWNIQGPGGSQAPRALCSGVSLSGIENRAFSTSTDPGRERPGQGSHEPRRSGVGAVWLEQGACASPVCLSKLSLFTGSFSENSTGAQVAITCMELCAH